MQGIPPVKDTDAEDVAWGLQTAEALWKRGERGDALVWLRRAAQAAGDSNDDDRALELARFAAELTEWMRENNPSMLPAATQPPPVVAPIVVTPSQAPSAENPLPIPPPPAFLGPIPTDLTPSNPPPVAAKLSKPPLPRPKLSRPPVPSAPVVSAPPPPAPAEPSFPPPEEARPKPPAPSPPSQPTMQTAEPVHHEDKPEEPEEPSTISVPPAERVHAGMFDPWNPPKSDPAVPAAPVVPPRFQEEEDEVITSANLSALRRSTAPAATTSERPEPPKARAPSEPPVRVTSVAPPAPSAPSPPKPPPLPPRAKKPPPPAPTSSASVDVVVDMDSAPALPAAPPPEPPTRPYDALSDAPPPPAPPTPAPPSPTQIDVPVAKRSESDRVTRTDDDEVDDPAMELTPVVGVPSVRPTAPSEPSIRSSRPEPLEVAAPPPPESEPAMPEIPRLDLESVDAFSDLPDDAREAFAAAATVSRLAEGEEVSHFALAYVIEGALDVAATMVDAPASRLATGSVLRARGTTDDGVPMRLICAGGEAVVATWSDEAVEEAFRTIPWVEDDLRAAADKVQTLVGITIGPMGERLDASLREQIVARLVMRPFSAGESVVKKGEPVPGLFLIGVGSIEVFDGDELRGTLGSGEFLFAGEVLHAGAAPLSARAGKGGALVLYGDRNLAQELMVTCPPLLEVFAGM